MADSAAGGIYLLLNDEKSTGNTVAYPVAVCPGGRDRYKGHAESYLKIGESMGKAMLELTRNGSK